MKHLRHNGVAAMLAIAALLLLVIGMVTPFVSMTKLGTRRVFSLVGGIAELYSDGNTFIATVLLVFSVMFPIAKLAMLLAATSRLAPVSPRARQRMHTIAVATGKYSLLDVLVVAVMIVLVKFGEFAEVRALPGVVVFGVAVLLSMAAGWCVGFDSKLADQDMNQAVPTVRSRRRPYRSLLLLVPGLAMLAVGLYLHYNVPSGGTVRAIKLATKPGMVGQAAEAVANIDPSTPDLYLKLFTPAGETKLPAFEDTPIGNGLTWTLQTPLPLADVQRVEVWDQHWITKDKQLDRITLEGWSAQGQRFAVDLLGEPNRPPKWSRPVAAVGGGITLLSLLVFVWRQVV